MPDAPLAALWAEEIPTEEWAIYQRAIHEVRRAGVRFALGGAFAVATYTQHWRDTKDLDFYVVPAAQGAMVQALARAGLRDYFDVLPYQRHWIYRAHQDNVIVDVIWAMSNRRAEVDELWLTRGPQVVARGETLTVLPAEELLWNKLYILQRDRCDWGDVLNILQAAGSTLDWEHLLARLEEDVPLLRGALSVFAWLASERSRELPPDLWTRLHLPPPEDAPPGTGEQRVNLIDTRPWFF